MVGVLLIVSGVVGPQLGLWAVIAAGVGVAVLTAGLSSALDSMFGLDAQSDISHFAPPVPVFNSRGLQAVHLGLSEVTPDSEFPRLQDAFAVDMMYNTGAYVLATEGANIVSALQAHGARVRILLADPDSPVLTQRALGQRPPASQSSLQQEIEQSITNIRRMASGINNRHASIEVRLTEAILTGSMLIVDRRFVRYIPYLPYVGSRDTPVFDIANIKGGELFNVYQDVFDEVWERSSPREVIAYPRQDSAADSDLPL
jgi:hypothetical protein